MTPKNNYLIQAESSRLAFLDWDQNRMIERFSLEHDENRIYLNFFEKRYCIERRTGNVFTDADNAPASFNAVMSIYDFLCYSKQDAVLSGEWCTIHRLNVHSSFGSSGNNSFTAAARKFSGKTELLKQACRQLGGHEATKADAGFYFNAFAALPVIFQFWDGDEEFAPQINILFDTNTLDFIHYETAWYICGHIIDLITSKMNE